MKVKNPVSSKKVERVPNAPSTLVIKSSPLLISPYKMRLVTELMRRQNLGYLLSHLPFLPHKGGRLILELLQKEVKYWEKKISNLKSQIKALEDKVKNSPNSDSDAIKQNKQKIENLRNQLKERGTSPNDFYIQKVQTNPGKIRKKIIFRAKGRADRIRRRSSLVEICLSKKN